VSLGPREIAQMQDLLRQATESDGDMAAFARLLTQIDVSGASILQVPELLQPEHVAFRIGITGPPGAGKSTLISELLKKLTQSQLKIGVLAVDPTSPISQGAILGDRIRYSEHTLNSKVFIRSLGTRGNLGGLSASAYLMLRAFDACYFDVVLVETVGVGQVEVEIMNVADFVTVVLVPESGDSIQAMKAGIIEIADFFIVNKSDRPGAESLKKEIESVVELSDNKKNVQVCMASALHSEGISEVVKVLMESRRAVDARAHRTAPYRLKEEAKALMRATLEAEAERRVSNVRTPKDLAELFQAVK
jgi:LAO/AO transport system kinase